MNITALPAPLRWREATAGDEAFLESLFAASREDLQWVQGDAAFVQQLVRMQRQAQEMGLRQNYPQALRLVIEREGEPVGHAIVNIGEQELGLVDIAVLPPARRAGIARAAVACVQREAAERGLPVGLMVGRANSAACALYASLGFAPLSQDTLFVQMQWRPA
jgi:ribosomal protein S18 acetylase RimI-like enzyme